ncbi:MAG: hypothetical protein J0M15_04375 [Deltaproteobacteria bacterium]|jgi:hypothetical protein|nr:hypothetical protein [Deltaproteobacteria bacterium]
MERDIYVEFKELEKDLKEQSDKTFLKEGFNNLNQLQRILLELVKEQIGYENSNSSTGKTR